MKAIDLKKDGSNGSRPSRREFVRLTTFGAVALGGGLMSACGGGGGEDTTAELLAAKPTGNVSTPSLSCGASTQVAITMVVTAGATGAPAGLSLQWMTAADYAANGNAWYSSDDIRLCKASFSGNAHLSRYNFGAQ